MSSCSNGNSQETQSSLQEGTTSESVSISEQTTTEAIQKLLIYSIKIEDNKETITQRMFEVQNNETLQNKLQMIAYNISADFFDNMKIEVTEIKDNIAYINLIDEPETSAVSGWIQKFQGSTGADITSTVLFENFFQKQLSYQWIDAIQLLHNGEIMEEMDHFANVGVVYKSDNYNELLSKLEDETKIEK